MAITWNVGAHVHQKPARGFPVDTAEPGDARQ